MPINLASQHSIDAFIDALWLEDGLSKNTLAAYRRDLTLYGVWLSSQALAQGEIDRSCEADLNAYFAFKHEASKATSANRRLTVLKRYFRWALRERRLTQDPTLKLQSARQALREGECRRSDRHEEEEQPKGEPHRAAWRSWWRRAVPAEH